LERGIKTERGLAPFRVNLHFVVTSVVHHEWLTMNGTRMNPLSLTHSPGLRVTKKGTSAGLQRNKSHPTFCL